MSKRSNTVVFGSPDYLMAKFADVKTAAWTTRSKVAKELKDLVAGLSTPEDQMYLYRTLKVTAENDGETQTMYLAHVTMGLNSPGVHDGHYIKALQRLIGTCRFKVLDVHIDAVDDLWDVLLTDLDKGA
jgi:hypothetical protein